jgi:hypothetical protein
MKKIPAHSLASLMLCTWLSACGGGGNESGPPDSILVSTADVKVGTSGNCVVGTGPEVHVFGGTPPYRLSNSVPQGMSLNKSVVQNSGDSFVITFINGVCMTTMPITIEDQMGRITKVLVSNGV